MADGVLPVTVLGGYLGAGKTTILNQVLTSVGSWTEPQRIAVLVNDFGDINIDADLIESADDDVISLSNGCICCSLIDGFAGALEQIRSLAVAPDRLIIETSGVADPHSVAAYAHTPGFLLDGVMVAVDVETIRTKADDKYVGQTVRSQIAAADLLVMTKADLVSGDELEVVCQWLGQQTGAPALVAANGVVPTEALFGIVTPARAGDHDHNPDHAVAEDQFVAASWSGGEIARASLDTFLAAIPPGVVRVKGVVVVAGEPNQQVVLQVVGERQALSKVSIAPQAAESRVAAIALRSYVATDADLEGWLASLS